MVDGKKKAKPPRPAPAPKKPENDSKTGKARGSAALAAAESDERHAAEDDDLLSSSDEQLKFKRSGTAPAQKKSLNVTKKQGKARASAALTAAENEEPDAAEAEGLPSSSDDDDSSLDKGAAGLLQLDGRKQNKKSETMSVDVWAGLEDGKLRRQGTVLIGKVDIPVGPYDWSDMYANFDSVNSAVDVKVGKAAKSKLLKKRLNIDILYGYPVKPSGVRGTAYLHSSTPEPLYDDDDLNRYFESGEGYHGFVIDCLFPGEVEKQQPGTPEVDDGGGSRKRTGGYDDDDGEAASAGAGGGRTKLPPSPSGVPVPHVVDVFYGISAGSGASARVHAKGDMMTICENRDGTSMVAPITSVGELTNLVRDRVAEIPGVAMHATKRDVRVVLRGPKGDYDSKLNTGAIVLRETDLVYAKKSNGAMSIGVAVHVEGEEPVPVGSGTGGNGPGSGGRKRSYDPQGARGSSSMMASTEHVDLVQTSVRKLHESVSGGHRNETFVAQHVSEILRAKKGDLFLMVPRACVEDECWPNPEFKAMVVAHRSGSSSNAAPATIPAAQPMVAHPAGALDYSALQAQFQQTQQSQFRAPPPSNFSQQPPGLLQPPNLGYHPAPHPYHPAPQQPPPPLQQPPPPPVFSAWVMAPSQPGSYRPYFWHNAQTGEVRWDHPPPPSQPAVPAQPPPPQGYFQFPPAPAPAPTPTPAPTASTPAPGPTPAPSSQLPNGGEAGDVSRVDDDG